MWQINWNKKETSNFFQKINKDLERRADLVCGNSGETRDVGEKRLVPEDGIVVITAEAERDEPYIGGKLVKNQQALSREVFQTQEIECDTTLPELLDIMRQISSIFSLRSFSESRFSPCILDSRFLTSSTTSSTRSFAGGLHYGHGHSVNSESFEQRHQHGGNSVASASSASGERRWEEEGSRFWQGARVPLKPWQQAAVAVAAAVGAALNPARADLVAAVGETTGGLALQRVLERMKRSPEGQRILADRPRVTSAAMGSAWDMPCNTFGAAYAKFMGDRNFSPDDRPPVRFIESEELAYVATRLREVHDFWHVLFELPTSVLGELALKMVEFHQTGLPMCFLSVAGASWRLKPKQRNYLFTHYAPWALKAGTSCSDLTCIYYEKHLNEDLEAFRRNWGVVPAPPLPKRTAYERM
ncbi:hypothetical protein R1flu_025282 [Riccia fluitans]|uniref:Ubiquinone biosynthesis protein COQ4 homolog, mitochondrial n=1 Tax=Riccia fluitans TaxID=41844 RepID=A0ABD1XXA2_9MARC